MTGQLVVLCGESFSGKGTVASFLAEALPGAVVSLEAINEERGRRRGWRTGPAGDAATSATR